MCGLLVISTGNHYQCTPYQYYDFVEHPDDTCSACNDRATLDLRTVTNAGARVVISL